MYQYPKLTANGNVLPYGAYIKFTVEKPTYQDQLSKMIGVRDNTNVTDNSNTENNVTIGSRFSYAYANTEPGFFRPLRAFATALSGEGGEAATNVAKSAMDEVKALNDTILKQMSVNATNSEKAIGEVHTKNGYGVQLYFPQNFNVGDRANYNTFNLSVEAEFLRDVLKNGSNADPSALFSIEGALMRSGLLGNNVRSNITLDTNRTADPSELMLFQRPEIRQFSFDFNMKPKNSEEAKEIINIVEFFRYELYPNKIAEGRLYQIPNFFNIQFGSHQQKRIHGLNGLIKKKCILQSMSTNYNPTNATFYKDNNGDLQFNEIQMTLSFKEISAITKDDLDIGRRARAMQEYKDAAESRANADLNDPRGINQNG